MAEVAVHLRYARIAPRKARLVADLVRGKSVAWAQAHLPFIPKKGARFMLKLLKSAVAAAATKKLAQDTLAIKTAVVQEGPRIKRARSHFRGVVRPIDKQMSHFTLVLTDERMENGRLRKKKDKSVGANR